MRILCIGNSFSCDATRYLHDIARADGEKIEIVNLYISGCPLERHFRNMHSDAPAYELYHNGQGTGFFVSLKQALLSRSFDYVTLQQASGSSAKAHTYEPYASELATYVRRLSPKSKLLVHQTWAYEDFSEKLYHVAGYQTSKAMFEDIEKAYDQMASNICADGIIPSGALFRALLDSGIERVQRDTFHASLGLGRYALGLLWYRMLTGKTVAENTFGDFDEEIPSEHIQIAKKCVDAVTPLA